MDARPGEEIFGMTMIVSKGKTILVADTNVTELPSAERLTNISKSCVRIARLFGFQPKVAFLSHSTFGKPLSRNTRHVREAIEKLKKEKVNFILMVKCSLMWPLTLSIKRFIHFQK